jgi:hypothetical protein
MRPAGTEVFWGELAPLEHSVQLYSDRTTFVDALEGYVGGGLRAGDSVIVMATAVHRLALERRLRMRGFDVEQARLQERYIPVNAADALAKFMAAGQPDPVRFKELVSRLISRAQANGRRVRAFGELVAILWSQGDQAAALQLEQLWDELRAEQPFCLFCAYPRSCFSGDAEESIREICAHHTRVIPD